MRDLEIVLCRLHSRFQPRYPRFNLCPECRADAPREAVVVEAVVNYFSKPEFREFSIETENEIQMGADSRRPDIVLLDAEGNFVAIAECKQFGVVDYGYEQLQSYLSATDTQFGVFANSKNPDQWEFYENLRRNKFTPMGRLAFERKIVTGRTIESDIYQMYQEVSNHQ
ncbi:MAG: type I restriction enzyme HsdR N-terminal domain-containing protein [Candidatus Poribacteria bacterium]|nr:type I restriction enzyme HsdR N-terminal domain-containing protein [Candidatus Poribacteria bacterium]